MPSESQSVPELVSVAFITYKRLALLQKTINSFRSFSPLKKVEYILCDDGSPSAQQNALRKIPFDVYSLPKKNRGLGANQNCALQLARGEFLVMIQDDWVLKPDKADRLSDALAVLKSDPSIGIVRLCGDPSPFPLRERHIDNITYWVCDHLDDRYINLQTSSRRVRVYSDTPHMRRSSINAPKILGLYRENCPMELVEMDYEDRIDAQQSFFIAFLSNIEDDSFENCGVDSSFRTAKIAYQMDKILLQAVAVIGARRESYLFKVGRNIWFKLRKHLI